MPFDKLNNSNESQSGLSAEDEKTLLLKTIAFLAGSNNVELGDYFEMPINEVMDRLDKLNLAGVFEDLKKKVFPSPFINAKEEKMEFERLARIVLKEGEAIILARKK